MNLDLKKPVELAEDVFWVGYYVPNDPFQCHAYLIRNGDESVLIDPGSKLVLEKIYSLVPLRDIKYIIMHHQDPDITGSYSTLEDLFSDGERYIVTHWRSYMLLKHYGWKTPFYLVDENGWKLKAGDRELEFLFTPYAHFPGAICTFDLKTKTLFSSDIFGAISDKFLFFAEDSEEYYRGVELFHKHYIPSNTVLRFALKQIRSKNPKLIAPQHGSVIREEMIDKIISRLENLECGLYLLEAAREESDIKLLAKLENWLKRLIDTVLSSTDFSHIAEAVYKGLKEEFPQIDEIIFVGKLKGRKIVYYVKDDRVRISMNLEIGGLSGENFVREKLTCDDKEIGELILKFKDKDKSFDRRFFSLLITYIKAPLSTILKKELEIFFLEEEANLDPLTNVYNKRYLLSFLNGLLKKRKKFSLAIVDIDDFKKVNDTYGHLKGDCVLKELAQILKRKFRKVDCVARFGGEEFVVVAIGMDEPLMCRKMNTIRKDVSETEICGVKVTFSAGVTELRDEDRDADSVILWADDLLYMAKESGKNRVICSFMVKEMGGKL